MTLLVVLLLLATLVLWSRLNRALRDLAQLKGALQDDILSARAGQERLQQEIDALRAQVAWTPPAVQAADAPSSTAQETEIQSRVTAPFAPPVTADAPAEPPAPAETQPEAVEIAPHLPAASAPAPAPVAAVSTDRESLETRIGSRWLLYIGVVAIVFGAAYFVKLVVDNEWITETGRVVIGAIVGLSLVFAGARFRRAGYALYGQMVSGGGIAVLYVCIYGAFNFYHLISRPTALVLMMAVTAATAWLADRQRSRGLAVMALGGGFVTPFLLAGGGDAQIALLSYDATLVAGTIYLGRRRAWWGLNLLSYAATVVTFMAWAATYYTSAKYLPTELFLTLFCGLFLYVLAAARRSAAPPSWFVRSVLWTAPILYYCASLLNLSAHSVPFLVFLIALAAAGVVAGRLTGTSRVRFAVWLAVIVPLFWWTEGHLRAQWLTAALATIGAIYLLNLIAQLDAIVRNDARLDGVDVGLFHLNGLASCAAAYLLVDAVRTDLTAWMVAGFAAWYAIVSTGLAKRGRAEAVHAGALSFTLLVAAIALALDGAAVTAAWAAEGAAVAWIGLRERRNWLRWAGLFLLVIAILRVIGLELAAPSVGQTLLWNRRAACAAFVIALLSALAWLHERERDRPGASAAAACALVAANLMILVLACGEINAYWMLHPASQFVEAAEIVVATLLEGSAIVWLGLKRRTEWVRVVGVSCIALGGLGLLSIQFEPAAPGTVIVLNARAGAGIAFVLVMYGLAIVHRRMGASLKDVAFQVGACLVTASLFTLSLLTSEINAFWEARGEAGRWIVGREAFLSVAWMGLAAVIVWIGLTRRMFAARLIGWLVLVVAVTRLLRLLLAEAPVDYVVLANPRMVASAIAIACLYGLAALYGRAAGSSPGAVNARRVLLIGANALTLVVVTREITAFWDLRVATTTTSSERFAREAMLSTTWAAYATALIVAGIRRNYAPIRYFAMAVFAVTIFKVFLIDLSELDRMYRVLSILGLGVMLLVTSYLYQRSRPVHDKA
jgi:hypothetical protein